MIFFILTCVEMNNSTEQELYELAMNILTEQELHHLAMNILTEQELHHLAMNIVGKNLESDGFEFLSVNSNLKKNPQFVCLKEKKIHFIIVRALKYPTDPNAIHDTILIEKVKNHALKFKAITYYAGVSLANASDIEKPIINGEKYIVDYNGIIEV